MTPSKITLSGIDEAQSRSRSSIAVSRGWSMTGQRLHETDFNIKIINKELYEIVRLMEINPVRTIGMIRSLLITSLSSVERKRWLSTWTDLRGFDLLQCAIINNLPNTITFLVRDMQLFPPTHFPRTNPYAHMAAMLGFKDSLEAVLTFRPDDFFAASEPSHMVKLPLEVVKRLKLGNDYGMKDKNLDKMVRVVKHETDIAERRPRYSRAFLVERHAEDDDLAEKIRRRRLRRTPRAYNKIDLPASDNIIPDKTDKVHQDIIREESVDQLSLLMNRRKCNESKVTVHMNVFDDDSLDRKEFRTSKTNSDDWSKRSQRNLMRGSISKYQVKAAATLSPRRPPAKNTVAPIEFGVRRIKKYKDFIPVIGTRHLGIKDADRYMGKTPLTLAAEKNHSDCVNFLLIKYAVKNVPTVGQKNNLLLAAKARSPEAIAMIMSCPNVTKSDYQSAVLLSLRDLYPDSLNMLLSLGGALRAGLFDGTNLFHTLYSESMEATDRFKLLPDMTKVLLQCNEDVNCRNLPRTYPMYSLIQSSFNVDINHAIYYLKCLEMLLSARANPHFCEVNRKSTKLHHGGTSLIMLRPAFMSAIHCILHSASASANRHEANYTLQVVLYKFIETVERYDKTNRRVSNDLLFIYMNYICRMGLSRRVLRALLRYGANPDNLIDGRCALNYFFEELFPFLVKYKIKHWARKHESTLNTLLILCRAMSQRSLHAAVVHFLDNHLLSTPIQAIALTRQFCYHANNMIISPRSLLDIAAQCIWVSCGRNSKRASDLPISSVYIQMIMP